MNELTVPILKSICPYASRVNLSNFLPYLNSMMPKYEINSLLRARHFIAQLAHESGSFQYVEELASGEAYEGRKDLGNIYPGDGVKFKGRGLIQITGWNNYTMMANELVIDCVNNPELIRQAKYAVESACWFWKCNGLNQLADTDDIKAVTKKINGGYNGLAERINFYNLAQKYIV
jgi:putative chitinase